jgi:multiple sugar transport system substrate-binding protein
MAACLLAAACVGGDEKSPAPAAAGPSGGEMTGELVVWDWDSAQEGFKKAFEQIDADFVKAHPGVTIKRTTQPFPQYAELMQATFTSKEGPCVAELLAARSGPAVLRFADGLVPLTSGITPEMRDKLNGLDVASADFDVDKEVYALPFGLQPQVMYYNKKLFAAAGLDPEQPPKTYQELEAAAKALKAKGITPFGGGNKEGFLSEWWFSFLWPGTGSIQDSYDLAIGKIKFTDPRVVETVNRYVGFIKAGYFPPGLASTPSQPTAPDEFAAGKQAMFVGLGSGGFASYVPFNKGLGAENVGVIEAVGAAGAPQFLPGGPASTWAIPEYCDKQSLAWEYIKHITGAQAQRILWEVGGIMPGHRDVQVGAEAPPQVQTMLADFRAAKTLYPPHGLWKPEVDSDFIRQLQLVIAGEKSVDDALASVQSTQERAG